METLKGKVALVTGAGKGIGRAVALRFAREGAAVATISRTASDLHSLKRQVPQQAKIFFQAGDASDEKAVRRFVKKSMETLGPPDCLINNAGILTDRVPYHKIRTADWERTMRHNLRGPFLMIKHVLPAMIRRRQGCIINVSSGAGKKSAPLWGAYAVSKFGLEGMTLGLAEELKNKGVRVNAVNPGGTRTRMRAAAYPDEDPSAMPDPAQVADLFVYLASDDAMAVTGQSIDYHKWREGV